MPFSSIGPAAGLAPPARSRSRLRACHRKYMRWMRWKVQARVWMGERWGRYLNGPINLGMHANEVLAGKALSDWVKAGARPDRGLPPGVLPKWVTPNARGTFDAVFQFAGESVQILGKRTAVRAFWTAIWAVARIRKRVGPLPRGVQYRANGFKPRYWKDDKAHVTPGRFPTPRKAVAALRVCSAA